MLLIPENRETPNWLPGSDHDQPRFQVRFCGGQRGGGGGGGEQQGVPAQVMDSMTLGGLDGLNAWTGISARGMEVWVLREDLVDHARQLLATYKKTQSTAVAEIAARGPVAALCEECSVTSVFPADCRGKTEVCPKCGSYLDVPEEGNDAEDIHVPRRSLGQIAENTVIYAAAFGLFSILAIPLIAILVDVISRWWK